MVVVSYLVGDASGILLGVCPEGSGCGVSLHSGPDT